MSYTLKFSDKTKTTDVVVPAMPPGINTVDTSLSLVGRGYPNYGEKVAENFLHLLENFASSVPPENPIEGQLWYDTSDPNNKVLRIMDGTVSSTRWPSITGIYQQTTDPKLETTQGLKEGDIWVDTFGNQLKIYSSGNWTLVGPQSTSTNTGAVPEYITDTSGTSHWVIKNYVNSKVISIVSRDSFLPNPKVDGFTSLTPGVNLVTGINAIFNGISSSTYNLSIGNSIYPVTAFLRKDNLIKEEVITGKVKFVESNGVVISSSSADSNTIQLYKNLNDAVLINNTAGGKIIFKTKGVTAGLAESVSIEKTSVKVSVTTEASSTTTGALVVTGGVAVGGNLHVGNKLYVNGFNLNTATLSLSNTAISTSTTTGALTVAGGVGIGGRLNIGNTATIYSTATSTSTTTGALTVAGGVGIGGRLNVGGRIFSGDIITSGFVLAAQNITSSLTLEGKNLEISGTDTSVSTITGAVTVVGGVGIGGNLNVGGSIALDNNFYLARIASNPILAFNPNSYIAFNRSTNQYYFYNTATTSLVIDKNYVSLPNTATSISTTTGALQVAGGVGIGGAVNIGQTSTIAGARILTTATAAIVYPEDFGAVGNGINNDTAAMQAAINTGKSVYLTDGKVYRITTSTTTGTVIAAGVGLIITTSNQRFGGPGIIQAEGNIEAVKVTGDCDGVELDLTFNSPLLSGTAVVIDFANRVSIRKIYGLNIGLQSGGSVLYVRQCNQCTVDWIWAVAGGAQFSNNINGYPSGTGITWYGTSAQRNTRGGLPAIDRSDILHINFAVINCGDYGLIWDGNCNSLSCSNLGLIATKGVIIRNTYDGNPALFTGTITNTTLTAPYSVTLVAGMTVTGPGILPNTVITVGGTGTSFTVNNSHSPAHTGIMTIFPIAFPGIARFTDLEIDYPSSHGVEILAGLDYDFSVPYIGGAGILYAEWIKPGTSIEIISLGNTNWTAIGASATPTVGEIFTATGTGSGTGYGKKAGTAFSGIKVASGVNAYQVRVLGGKAIGCTGYGIENAGGAVYFDGTSDLSANTLGRTTGTILTTLGKLSLDDNFYFTMNGDSPLMVFGENSYISYDRTNKQLNFTIDAVGSTVLNKNYVQTYKPLITPTYRLTTTPTIPLSAYPLLPTAGFPEQIQGMRAFVVDANTNTFYTSLFGDPGSGPWYVPVFCDNTGQWRIG
jgi:hypothetical protein